MGHIIILPRISNIFKPYLPKILNMYTLEPASLKPLKKKQKKCFPYM